MRQGQQNRRGRGRNRKTQNPLSRNYESNGPDVKIRGTAAHIAEKYASLARDSLANGDTVTSENYYQHAEHYIRIIMAAQAQNQSSQQQRETDAVNGQVQETSSTIDVDANSEADGDPTKSADDSQQPGNPSAPSTKPANNNSRRRRRSSPNGVNKKSAPTDDAEKERFARQSADDEAHAKPKKTNGQSGEETAQTDPISDGTVIA